jgi:hypothetical protein
VTLKPGPAPALAGQVLAALRAGLLLTGLAALIVGAIFIPQGRARVLRDPYAAAYAHLLEVEPGMRRSVLESHLHLIYRRQDGVEVFSLPDSDAVRLDIRLSGPQPEAQVTAVGEPYFTYAPRPNHLTTP